MTLDTLRNKIFFPPFFSTVDPCAHVNTRAHTITDTGPTDSTSFSLLIILEV